MSFVKNQKKVFKEKMKSCINSEMDLFQEQNYQNMIRDSLYTYHAADVKSNDKVCYIDIDKTDKYLDLSKSFLKLKIKVFKKADGTSPSSTDKISVTNNLFSYLFSQVQVKLDNYEIENTNNTYAVQEYIKKTLNEGDTHGKYLQNFCYYCDTPGEFDNFDIDIKPNKSDDSENI